MDRINETVPVSSALNIFFFWLVESMGDGRGHWEGCFYFYFFFEMMFISIKLKNRMMAMLWFNQNCSTISGSTSSACGSNAWTTSERKSRKPEALLAEAASWEDPPAVLRCAGCAGNFANNNNSNVNVVDFLFFFLCLGIFFDNFYSLVHHLEFIFRPDFSHRWDFRAPHRSWLNIDEESSEDPPPSLLDIDFTAGWIVVLLRSFTFMQHQLNGVAHSIGLRIQHPPEFFFLLLFTSFMEATS